MAKSNRGKALREFPSRKRGNCPLCSRTRVKLLYEVKVENKPSLIVCKSCRKRSVSNSSNA